MMCLPQFRLVVPSAVQVVLAKFFARNFVQAKEGFSESRDGIDQFSENLACHSEIRSRIMLHTPYYRPLYPGQRRLRRLRHRQDLSIHVSEHFGAHLLQARAKRVS